MFGQLPNTLERFDLGNGSEALQEEGLDNLFADTDDVSDGDCFNSIEVTQGSTIPDTLTIRWN